MTAPRVKRGDAFALVSQRNRVHRPKKGRGSYRRRDRGQRIVNNT